MIIRSSGGGFKLFLRNRDIRRVNIVNEPKHENTKEVTNSFVDVFAWKPGAHDQIVQSIPRVGRIASLALPASFMSSSGDDDSEMTPSEGGPQTNLVQEGVELLSEIAKAGTQAAMSGEEPGKAALQT